jgi:hypothetical protein
VRLSEIAITAYVVAVPVALFVARRFPDPRVRYLLLMAMLIAGLYRLAGRLVLATEFLRMSAA